MVEMFAGSLLQSRSHLTPTYAEVISEASSHTANSLNIYAMETLEIYTEVILLHNITYFMD